MPSAIKTKTSIGESVKNPTLDHVLNLAENKPRRKDTKPFSYEVHGEKAFIHLQNRKGDALPWIIPADWLPVAQALWPVHIRQNRTGPYLNIKSRLIRNGKSEQISIPVHHLFVALQQGWTLRKGETVLAHDGNFLNFADGNLYVQQPSSETEERSWKRRVRQFRAGDSRLPDTRDLLYIGMPSRSTRVPVLE
jgi:hypothetical protein